MSRNCAKHRGDIPCTCAMGNIYRFVEPVILFLLKERGRSYGYDLVEGIREHALTDSEIEGAALYRTLRRLEQNGFVRSSWNPSVAGPARRTYILTKAGEGHLKEWADVLEHLAGSMRRFVRNARSVTK